MRRSDKTKPNSIVQLPAWSLEISRGTFNLGPIDFYVKEGVLIPRPDTEVLVEEIIELCKDKEQVDILDIGTGSGAITVSLAKYIENANLTSFDINDK